MVEDGGFEKKKSLFVAEVGVTHSPFYFTGILINARKKSIAVLVDANVTGIATRGCSLG